MGSSSISLGGLPVSAGDVLLRRYRVERLIGEGGTGLVLAATDLEKEKEVAIKFLRRALASDEVKTRFEREARAMSSIDSEHVVPVLEAGALDDGSPYMVMEYLDGRDLARVLKEDGPLGVEQSVDCMLQVCRVLQIAHANGIVHRDLKPANLFLVNRSDESPAHVKVLDFGISKFLDKKLLSDEAGWPAEVTSAFAVLGSPRYMAPEQVRNSKDIDQRADLWSVGAVLYQLLTGKHAFPAESNVQASVAVLSAEPSSLCEDAPHVPRGLEKVVRRCLTRDVEARFQTAEELAKALEPFAPSGGTFLDKLASGQRDVPTERKLRVATAVVPSTRVRIEAASEPKARARKARLVFSGWTMVAFVVVLGGIAAASTLARQKNAKKGVPAATALDAGQYVP